MARLVNLDKRFGGTHALREVSLAVPRGGVVGLVGENGAGKSTLGKVIAGALAPDAGEYYLDGESVHFNGPRHALQSGVALIAQELVLVPGLSVLDNVFMGAMPKRLGIQDRRGARRRYEELEEWVGFGLDPDAGVANLRLADCQKVEILRALARDTRLIVMDEPTAALARADAIHLLDIVRHLAASETSVVYVSHNLEEVLEIADSVVVMRDGRVVRTAPASSETKDSLVQAMLGVEVGDAFPKRRAVRSADASMVVQALSRPPAFADVSFELRTGEILGLTGLVGAGRTELARCLFGADRATTGRVSMNGKRLDLSSPPRAIRAGIGLIPESRKEEGLVLGRTVEQNMIMVHMRRLARSGVYSSRRARAELRGICSDIQVAVRDQDRLLETQLLALSGGNQQKVMIGKWLLRPPKVLILDEPTRGVDVGAKRAIYEVIEQIAEAGSSILLISSEIEEVMGLADRILVMAGGRLTGEFDAGTATEEEVMRAAFARSTVASTGAPA